MTTEAGDSTEQGRYLAFGMTIIGPRRYLDGHCHSVVEGVAAVASELLRIEVTHEPTEHASRWETVLTHDAETAANAGHRFLRVLKNAAGARRYEIIDGLSVEADPGARHLRVCAPATMHPDSLGSFICGTAMLCYFKAQQRLCLHAAVVVRGQQSVMICGASGAGKSSFAAALQEQGWSIVVEDLAVVEPAVDGYGVRPGYGRLRLWSDSVAGLSLTQRTSRIVVGADKYYLPLDTRVECSPPLTTLVFLGQRLRQAQTNLQMQPLATGAVALTQLYRNSLAAYLNTPPEVSALLAQCRGVVTQSSVYELRLADDWSRLPSACEQFAQQLNAADPS